MAGTTTTPPEEQIGDRPVTATAPARGAAAIAAHLRQAIRDGVYAHGTQLPTERALAETFGASRTTVRRALEQLETSRLVIRRVGSGTFVNYDPAGGGDEIAEITSPLELMEVRFAVEPHLARLAVLNATPRDLERIADALAQLEDSGANAEHFTAWDQTFHLALAESTHNPLIVSIYRQINDIRGHDQWRATKDKILSAGRIRRYNQQHRTLFELLCRRDADGAAKLMQAHLNQARRDLLGAGSG